MAASECPDQWECDNHPRRRAMFRLIGCQWQWQWQIRVHIQIATSSVVAVALFTRSLSLSVYPCLQTALTSETRAGLGQALELPPICMGCALQPEHLSRLLATHWAKGAMRCGCFSRCKQMPRVYLVRVRMCTGHQAALALQTSLSLLLLP